MADTTRYPERTHGKIFLTFKEFGDSECSATVVPGNTGSTLLTAAHCVYDREAGFASKFMFVPGYMDGAMPHGAWVAKRLVAAKKFRADTANVTADVAAVELRPDEFGRRVEEVVGSRGVAFDQPRKQSVEAFGYPALPAMGVQFEGERLWMCDTRFGGKDASTKAFPGPPAQRIGCSMTSGASGGGWVFGASGSQGGFVESVTSYGYPTEPEHLYGPYFSRDARRVWIAGQDSCKGKLATLVGTDSSEKLIGTADD
ncbi:MAG: trypsin-like serine peptidase, partial [Solirubrobacterales bacterium]